MSSLYHQLENKLDTCVITKKPYLPLDILDTAITTKSVRDIMPRIGKLYLRLFNRGFDVQIQDTRKIIAILALLDRLDKKSMKSVILNRLTDEHLPLRKNEQQLESQKLEKKLSFPSLSPGDIDRFIKIQWAVIRPYFDPEARPATNIQLEGDCPLPFASIEKFDRTLFSNVYKAEFKHAWSDTKGSKSHPIAIKQFIRAEGETDYKTEKDVLNKIQSNKDLNNAHLVRHLAFCDQIQCIIFPWAGGGNLKSFWQQKTVEGATPDVLVWSLKQLVGLAGALTALHKINIRHGDVKPTNILHFHDDAGGFGILKLADVGVSRVHEQETNMRQGPTSTRASTLMYEAPEASEESKNKTPRSRRFDCWSMGCIILEFVIWMLYDNNAIESFEQARRCPDNSFYEVVQRNESENIAWQDRMRRYPSVDEAINILGHDERCAGAALGSIVEFTDVNLLKIDPRDRCLATKLHEKLEGILKSCQEEQMQLIKPGKSMTVPQIFSIPSQASSSAKIQHTFDTTVKVMSTKT